MEEKNVGKHFFPSPKPGTNNKTKQYLRKFMIHGNPILYLTFIIVYTSFFYSKFYNI